MSINADRIFQGKSRFPEHEEWFYRTREGIAGPYLRREDADFALHCFIKYCKRNGFTGGRRKRRVSADIAETLVSLGRSVEEALPAGGGAFGVLFGGAGED